MNGIIPIGKSRLDRGSVDVVGGVGKGNNIDVTMAMRTNVTAITGLFCKRK